MIAVTTEGVCKVINVQNYEKYKFTHAPDVECFKCDLHKSRNVLYWGHLASLIFHFVNQCLYKLFLLSETFHNL